MTETPQTKVTTGQSCFRFLIPTEKAKANPITKAFLEKTGLDSMHIFSRQKGQRLTMYPCRSGKLLNLGLFFMSGTNKDEARSSWLNSGSLEDLMAQIQGWSAELRELCSMAEDVKLWSLDTRDPPRTFYRNKLVLMGDAAHPTLPRMLHRKPRMSSLLTINARSRTGRGSSHRGRGNTWGPLLAGY
jgi:salicylate hydroxylase